MIYSGCLEKGNLTYWQINDITSIKIAEIAIFLLQKVCVVCYSINTEMDVLICQQVSDYSYDEK